MINTNYYEDMVLSVFLEIDQANIVCHAEMRDDPKANNDY